MTENGIHEYWWTTLMAMPTSPESAGYKALRRVWADPTINTVVLDGAGRLATKRNRGIYRPDSEDHMMVALFENWAAFPDCGWVETLLQECGISVEVPVEDVGWSYEYTQSRTKKKPGKLTADIVVHWHDAAGAGVLVFETKRPGNRKLDDKDIPSNGTYLDVPGFDGISRRFSCLILARSDVDVMSRTLEDEPVLTWERLLGLQVEQVMQLKVPLSVRSFMAGALLHQSERYGIEPDPLPFDWLYREPAAHEITSVGQTGKDRRIAYWKYVRQAR